MHANNRLKYEPTTGEYVNNRGVETRIPDFGGTSSIEYMDPDTKFSETTDYFYDMVQWFVDKGYTRGKDIVGAPYDWRYSPSKYLSCSISPSLLTTIPLIFSFKKCIISWLYFLQCFQALHT